MIHDANYIEIDGAQGEGGGQVLRSSLSLSILTGKPVHLYNIRANRSKPGLMHQHLQAVDAAAAISKAHVVGAALNSQSISFHPEEIRSGRYRFDIGTAGSTALVLQTIFTPLSQANSASSIIITGGTHVLWSPTYEYIDLHWMPLMHAAGFDGQIDLDQAGFYPQGGGRISANIRPAGRIRPICLTERGKLLRIRGIAGIANLERSIAERMKRHAVQRLNKLIPWDGTPELQIKPVEENSPSKGAFFMLLAEFESGRACYTALGEPGKPAERVADEAIDELLAFFETRATIDPFLADQLLLPLSLSGGISELITPRITEHLLTNATILQTFLPCKIEIDGALYQPGAVRIYGTARS
jgi:RNA 3'-terminal phosphate cyclase (ATP)